MLKTTFVPFLCRAIALSSLLSLCVVKAMPITNEENFPDQKVTSCLPSISEDASLEKRQSDALSKSSGRSFHSRRTTGSATGSATGSSKSSWRDLKGDYTTYIGEKNPAALAQLFLGKGDKTTTLQAFFTVMFGEGEQETRVMPVLSKMLIFFGGSREKMLPQAFKEFRKAYETLAQGLTGSADMSPANLVYHVQALCDAIKSALFLKDVHPDADASLPDLVTLLINSLPAPSLPSGEERKEESSEEGKGDATALWGGGTGDLEAVQTAYLQTPLLQTPHHLSLGFNAQEEPEDDSTALEGKRSFFPRTWPFLSGQRPEANPLLSSQDRGASSSSVPQSVLATFQRYGPTAVLMAGAFAAGQVCPRLLLGGK